VEALQCRMWPPLDGVAGYGGSGPASKEEVHKEHQSAVEALRAKLKQASPKQAVAEPSASSQAEAKARRDSELAQRDAQAEAYLEQLAGEPDDACYEALREHAPGAARRYEELAGVTVTAEGGGNAAALERKAEGVVSEPDKKAAAAAAEEEEGGEEQAESMEKLLEQMAFLRDKGGTLSDSARREQATSAALAMARMMGDDEDESSDEEAEDGTTV